MPEFIEHLPTASDLGVTKIPEPIREPYFIGLGIDGNHNYFDRLKSRYFQLEKRLFKK